MNLKNIFGEYIVAFQQGLASKRNSATLLATFLLCFGILTADANAQKGVGDATGVASQPQKPEIVTLAGKLVSIKTGPCEATTGHALVGTHILLETPGKELLNIHLGPAVAVADVVAKLSVGQEIRVQGFRTEKMKENQYVAQSLTFNQTTVELRDANLRPVWARSSAGSLGRAAGQGGGGRGWRGGR